MDNSTQLDWASLLGRVPAKADETLASAALQDRCVLITGAGGSIGSGLAVAALRGKPRSLLLLDSSEGSLYECLRRISAAPALTKTEIIPIVGNVAHQYLLNHLFHSHPIDLVLHTAAYKHVPLMEANPFSAIANNCLGTYRLVTAALEAGVRRLVLLSTDKAVHPYSIMGASKRIAEQIVLSHATELNRLNAVRLGNVLGSAGSVVPIFAEQLRLGSPLTVTHPEVSRYFLTQSEAEASILGAATTLETGRIFIPNCGDPIRIVDLARSMGGPTAEITFIGLREGDKLHETLIADDEKVGSDLYLGMQVVDSPRASLAEVVSTVKLLEAAIDRFNYSELITAVRELVPTYQPIGSKVAEAIASGVR